MTNEQNQQHLDEAREEYSTLEAVDPQPHHQPIDDGLQLQHLYGDETLNGKEVAKAEGLQVAQDDDKEFMPPSDVEKGDKTENIKWWKRRVLGVPMLLIIALAGLLAVGVVVGGAVGGSAARNAEGTPPIPTSSATVSSTETSGSTTSETTTATPLPLPARNELFRLIYHDSAGSAALTVVSTETTLNLTVDSAYPSNRTETEPEQWWYFWPAPLEGNITFSESLFWIMNSNLYGMNSGPTLVGRYLPGGGDGVFLGNERDDMKSLWYLRTVPNGRSELKWRIHNVGMGSQLLFRNGMPFMFDGEALDTEYWTFEKLKGI